MSTANGAGIESMVNSYRVKILSDTALSSLFEGLSVDVEKYPTLADAVADCRALIAAHGAPLEVVDELMKLSNLRPCPWLRHEARISVKQVTNRGDEYDLELDNGKKVKLGTCEDLLVQKSVKARLLRAVPGKPIRKCTEVEWDVVVGEITWAAEVEDLGTDDATMLEDWLTEYLRDNRPGFDAYLLSEKMPYIRGADGSNLDTAELCISATKFGKWLRMEYGAKISDPALRLLLRRCGWQNPPGGVGARDESGELHKCRTWTKAVPSVLTILPPFFRPTTLGTPRTPRTRPVYRPVTNGAAEIKPGTGGNTEQIEAC